MKKCALSLLLLFILIADKSIAGDQPQPSYLKWSKLPSVPDSFGFAGSFAGVSNGALIVAGGANFSGGGTPWNGASKRWYDKVFVLESPSGSWKEAGKLPAKKGYGVSLTWGDGIVCLGGSDASQVFSDAFILRYVDGKINTESLPQLPAPSANACGAIIGNVVYIAGGITNVSGNATEKSFWSLDLSATGSERTWKILDPWPGASRMLSVAGVQGGSFYLFSGADVRFSANDSSIQREYLKDAYKYTPGKGWLRLPDMPRPTVAAPGPAYTAGQSHLLIFGGDEGTLFSQNSSLREKHPGFSHEILAFNTITSTWSTMGSVLTEKQKDSETNPYASTWSPVTTPLVIWNGNAVLPGGEVRPAVRASNVLFASPTQPPGAFRFFDWMVVALYFVLLISISVYVSRRMKSTTNDFFLGGGKIPWWAAGLSIFGSKLSALTFIAIPAKAYATDWVYMLSNIMIVVVAPIIVYFYLPYFRKMKLTSVYEYLRIRFDGRVRFLGSLNFVIFQISRLGIVIYLPALVLSSVTGINIFICIIGTSLITTAYSISGGIEAVIWTEVMQVGVLLGGALLSLIFIADSIPGGFGEIISEASEYGKFRMAILEWNIAEPVLWVVLLGGFLTQLVTYSSDQVVVQRYLTTSTEKEARQSIYTNAILVIPATLIFFSVGTALWVYFRHNPTSLNPHSLTDDVFPWFISQKLPEGLSGLVIAGLFAATMSTISSSMNSIATVVTTDFYKPFRPGATDHQRFVFARWTTLVLGVLGCGIAVYLVTLQNASIWDQYLKIIGLFGGCLAGMFVAGIFFPKINSIGILIGFILSAVILYFIQGTGKINFFLYPVVAIVLCVGIGYLSSLIFPTKAKVLLILLLVCNVSGIYAQGRKPNILFVISDDQSFESTSVAGCSYINTPNFDRVAKEGVLYKNAYSASPGCSPSRAGILTGRYTWQIREAGTHASSFPADIPVFPDLLEKGGYFVGFTGKGWAPGDWEISGRTRNPAGQDYQAKKFDNNSVGLSPCDYVSNFRDFYKKKPDDKPFYFWLGTHEPHRLFELNAYKRTNKSISQVSVPGFLPDDSVTRGDLLDYAMEIEYMDDQLGKALQFLKECGELDNTIVVVTSDNGMSFPSAKANCYEYGVHVPLAIKWNKIVQKGRQELSPVSLLDLMPTFLEAAGLKDSGSGLAGKSLMNNLLFKKDDIRDRSVYFARERHSEARYQNLGYPQRGIRRGNYLYIHNFKPDRYPAGDPLVYDKKGRLVDAFADIDNCPTFDNMLKNRTGSEYISYFNQATAKRPADELFDVIADPYCTKNLASEKSLKDVKQKLRSALFEYLIQTGDPRLTTAHPDISETYPRLQGAKRKFPSTL